MDLHIRPFKRTAVGTLSRLFIDCDKVSTCFVLEDTVRDTKVPGETAIPAGSYQILPRRAGAMHGIYERKYGASWHRGMMHLQNVPQFTWVYIHIGNTTGHTRGCPLVGMLYREERGNIRLLDSATAYRHVYERVRAAWERGERVNVHIQR